MTEPNASRSILEAFANRFFRDTRMLVLTLALIVVAGLSSIAIMPRMEDPILSSRSAIVVTRMPGAEASRVESLVTEKIESAMRDVEEIKEITSTSRAGVSTISIELRDSIYDTDTVWSKVRTKVEDSISLLPSDASRPVFEENNTRAYAMILGISWDQESPPDYRVLRRLAIDLQNKLQNESGTEDVDIFGDPGEEISVRVDPIRAASMGLSPAAIAGRVANYDAKGSAGQLRDQPISMLIEVENQLDAVASIASIPVASQGGKDVRLSEVGDVQLSVPSPLPRAAKLDGKESVVLGVMVRKESRIDQWTAGVNEFLAEYEASLPAGITLDRLMIQDDYVAARMGELTSNLVLGAGAVAVVIFFLMGWRAAIIVTLTLPLASLMTLFGMKLWGIPIHQMSVTGLIIAFGLLIDNAIVTVDEVKGRLRKGIGAAEAMAGSVKHLAVPLLGSTLTTAFAFAPIALMPGGGGEFVGAIAIGVIMAICSSFLLALTVIPTLAAMFLKQQNAGDESVTRQTKQRTGMMSSFLENGISIPPLANLFQSFLRVCISRPWIGVATGICLPFTGFFMASTLKEQFFPPCDRNQFHIQVDMPITASIGQTRLTADRVDAFVREQGAQRVDWFYGESAPSFYYNVVGERKGQPNFAQAIVTLGEGVNPKPKIREVQKTLDRNFLKPRILVRQLEQGPPFEAPVEVRLFGPDLAVLRDLGDEIRKRVSNHPDVVAVRSDLSEVLPQLSFKIDESIAMSAGITPAEVAEQLATTLEGARGGSVLQDNEELPVVVRIGDADRGNLARIEGLDLVLPPAGEQSDGSAANGPNVVPLSTLASVSLVPESASISRLDRRRMNEVSIYITAGVLPSVVQSYIQDSLAEDELAMPAGYSLAFGGESGKRDESVGNLVSTVGLLGVMMVATLVLSFGSFRMATIIGLVGILSVGLSLLALAIGQYPFGFISIIGTMGLLGVAINDSIVVLSGIRTNQAACEGDVDAAVYEVMHASRHVVATTITTIAGFAPLIIAGGEFWPPLAVAISGGVAGATLLALVLVPSLHQMLIASRVGQPSLYKRLSMRLSELFWTDAKPRTRTKSRSFQGTA